MQRTHKHPITVTIAVTIASSALTLLASCGSSHDADPEQEPDYAPGFFTSDVDTTAADRAGGETNSDLPPPDAVEGLALLGPTFPQTKWDECADDVTGNYIDIKCARARGISVILDRYLQERLVECVDAGLAAQGGGTAAHIHVTHDGITADARHSPKSLHAVNRAIDVKAIRVILASGEERTYTYSKTGNRAFYTALRQCWGRIAHNSNGCPYYEGQALLTGSIGWENADHGRHMHLSMPYCVNGSYGSGLWYR